MTFVPWNGLPGGTVAMGSPADDADEAAQRGAVRIRRSERVTGKPLQNNPWSAEPNHECVDARFRQTDNDGEAVGQSACAQTRS